MNKKSIKLIIYIITFVILLFIIFLHNKNEVTYQSNDGKIIKVVYIKNKVKFKINKNKYTLYQTISASGIRYSDKNKIFWEHQGIGSFYINDKLIFSGKIIEKNEGKQK